MDGATYSGALAAAPRVAEHFARHIEAARANSTEPMAFAPDERSLEAIIDAAFWASLRREEGYAPKISLAFLPPEQGVRPMMFERPLALDASALARVAPAVERAGIHLGIWPRDGQLSVWGTTRTIPSYCFVLEVASPGLLVIKHHRGDVAGKFVNVAVLEGDRLKIIDERASSLPDCPPLVTSLLGFQEPASWENSVNVLVQLAVSMRGHGRGGALLVVPAGSDTWRESMVRPISYVVAPHFGELADLMRDPSDHRRVWQEALATAVDTIAASALPARRTFENEKLDICSLLPRIHCIDFIPLNAK